MRPNPSRPSWLLHRTKLTCSKSSIPNSRAQRRSRKILIPPRVSNGQPGSSPSSAAGMATRPPSRQVRSPSNMASKISVLWSPDGASEMCESPSACAGSIRATELRASMILLVRFDPVRGLVVAHAARIEDQRHQADTDQDREREADHDEAPGPGRNVDLHQAPLIMVHP